MRSKYILLFAFGIGLLLIGVCEGKMYNWVDQSRITGFRLFFKVSTAMKVGPI